MESNNNNGNQNRGAEYDDIEVTETASGDRQPAVEEGTYEATFLGCKVVDTPDWKLEKKRADKPDREPDLKQWQWDYVIEDEDGVEHTICDWTNRTWHEKAKASQHIAALLGRTSTEGIGAMDLRTSQFTGATVYLSLTESNGKNYIAACTPIPKRKGGQSNNRPGAPGPRPTQQASAVPTPTITTLQTGEIVDQARADFAARFRVKAKALGLSARESREFVAAWFDTEDASTLITGQVGVLASELELFESREQVLAWLHDDSPDEPATAVQVDMDAGERDMAEVGQRR